MRNFTNHRLGHAHTKLLVLAFKTIIFGGEFAQLQALLFANFFFMNSSS